MNNLLKKIALNSQLITREIYFQNLNTIFAYYEKEDDFFIFILSTHSELLAKLNTEKSDLEYSLNRFVYDYKKQNLQEFASRNIDNNLSLIVVLNEELTDIELTDLYKIEENPFNSKKYILLYKERDLDTLISKLEDIDDMIIELNRVAISNSALLQGDEGWYKLLMKLFVKIPFLNYTPLHDDYKLEDLEKTIESKLNLEQKNILKDIIDRYDAKNGDINSLVESINLGVNNE